MNHYTERKYVFMVAVILVGVLFIGRLFYIQVIDKSYEAFAQSNSQSVTVIYPARGLIYDRNGKLMVYNQAAYDIMVTPMLVQGFDTTGLCNMLGLTPEKVKERLNTAKSYSRRVPSVFMKQVDYETAAVFQEKMFQYPGFYVLTRTLRNYQKSIAAHALGYVGEVDQSVLNQDPYFQMGDYIGISGIEKAYESFLRGVKGKSIFLKNAHNQTVDSYQDGKYDVPVTVGKNISITLDSDLQEYGEKLMKPYLGSIVAIEPPSGEILALISAPYYSPDSLVGRRLGESFKQLSADTLNPLFNRALMAQYPPGSTFKTIMGVIGLQEKVISPSTEFHCSYGFWAGNIHTACHLHDSPLNLITGIQNSCNTYFINVLKRILEDPKMSNTAEAYDNWREHLVSFGFTMPLGIELTSELKGNIPTSDYFDNLYGRNHWNYLTVRSLAIGQGELLMTPLQMANAVAAIANRGYYIIPHLIRQIEDEESIPEKYITKIRTSIDSVNFIPIIEGMDLVVNGGRGSTARNARIDSIVVCGKTGTAENPHGNDHSIFIAFAPRDNPRIAIAVFVENQGFGTTYAAPIASLMIEKYLTGEVKRKWYESWVLGQVQPQQVTPEPDTTASDTITDERDNIIDQE
ncbi:MAG: penicillin-binding protein 2 [Bacteroidales bacterium]|nr:penicillin-binding protein 2 [Bacteroidales bacterium]MBN2699595.1 penicillin-binding protein 2 [Bacteroidales bacterium]